MNQTFLRIIIGMGCIMVMGFGGCKEKVAADPAKAIIQQLDSLDQRKAFASPMRKQLMIELADVWLAKAEQFENPDSGAYYTLKAANLLGNNLVGQYDRAILNLRLITQKYAASPIAADAWFYQGFIQNTELNNVEAARVAYEAFLEKYPDHELAADAKRELSTLGLTPEQQLELILSGNDSTQQGESTP